MTDEYHDENEEQDQTPEAKNLSQSIDEGLMNSRPERYSADDDEWKRPLYEQVADKIRQDEAESSTAIEDLAKRRVNAREEKACRDVHRDIRSFKDGQFPLGWGEGDDWKQFFKSVLTNPVRFPKSRAKIRFQAMSDGDWDQWAIEFKEERRKRNDRDEDTETGALVIAKMMRQQGVNRTEDLQPQEQLPADPEADS